MSILISLVSFAFCFFLASFVVRYKVFGFLTNRNGRFVTLDGLRGYLALSVLFHHFLITFHWKNNGVWQSLDDVYFQNYGEVGVAIFFMITGFLFTPKLLTSPNKVDWIKLYESRVFRIYPLYFIFIAITSYIAFLNTDFILSENANLIKDYFKWFVFYGSSVNNFSDTPIIGSGVYWTLKYEWLFYISLPLIYTSFKVGGNLAKIAIGLACILLYLKPINLAYNTISTEYFILFFIGGFTSYIANNLKLPNKIIDSKIISLISLISLIYSLSLPKGLTIDKLFFISFFFIITACGNDLFGILRRKSSILLGEISYSIYLLHGFVLYLVFTQAPIIDIASLEFETYLLFMPIVSMIVVSLSTITFLSIERPAIILGRKAIISKVTHLVVRKLKSFGKKNLDTMRQTEN